MNLIFNERTIEIQLTALERLWACHLSGQIEIPIDNILRAKLDRPNTPWWTEVRAPGTHLPGLFKAGTYYTERGREFWYVHTEQPTLWLDIADRYYKRIVLGSAQAEQWRSQIQSALDRTTT